MSTGWSVALLGGCCLAVAACGGSGGDDDAVAPATTAAAAEAPIAEVTVAEATTAEVTVAETPAPDPSDPNAPTATEPFCPLTEGDMEGCYAYEDMQAFYDEAIGLLDAFLADTFADPAPVQPSEYIYVEEGATGVEPCTDPAGGFASYTDVSFEYCPTDQVVYVGQAQLWQFYTDAGDAGAVIGIAHEVGHHIQTVAGVLVTTAEDIIATENQADCVAGVFTAWADSQEMLVYPDDLEDIDVLLALVASVEDEPNRDHGTLEERTDAFIGGFERGMEGCSEFFPATPLIPPG